jgi:hypothetical protein
MYMNFKQCGLMCAAQHPIFGASSDGINSEFTVEIKCPINDKSYFNFIDKTGNITPRYKSQVQLQLHISGRKFALFCVASPEFEKNKLVKIIKIPYDKHYIMVVMLKAEIFWKETISKFVLE